MSVVIDNDVLIVTLAVDSGETSIKRGTRLCIKVTSGVTALATAGANDLDIGVADEDWSSNTALAAPSRGIRVKLYGVSRIFIASGAITAGTQLARAASGKVTAGTGLQYVAWKGATADGDWVTGYYTPVDSDTQPAPTGGS